MQNTNQPDGRLDQSRIDSPAPLRFDESNLNVVPLGNLASAMSEKALGYFVLLEKQQGKDIVLAVDGSPDAAPIFPTVLTVVTAAKRMGHTPTHDFSILLNMMQTVD